MSDNQLQQEIERAARAKEVLEHPLWVDAWETLRERCLSAWENGATTEVREEAWRMLHIAKKTRKAFEDLVTTGRMAEIELEKRNG